MRQRQQGDATFGPRLKAHRERRGITLEAVAASTKIKASLLADLENNNIVNWPEGIYRRAWLREYAITIGMPPEPVLEEFARLFPETGETAAASKAGPPALRLTFTDTYRRRSAMKRERVMDALAIFMVVLACGGVLMALSGLSFWTASGTVALIWYPIANAVYGGVSLRGLFRSQIARIAPLTSYPFVRALRRPSPSRWLAVVGCRMRSLDMVSRLSFLSRLSGLAAGQSAR